MFAPYGACLSAPRDGYDYVRGEPRPRNITARIRAMIRPRVESLPPERGRVTPTDALSGETHSRASSVKGRFQRFSLHPEPGFLGAPCATCRRVSRAFQRRGRQGQPWNHTGTRHRQRDRRYTLCDVSKQTGPRACVLVLVFLVAKT